MISFLIILKILLIFSILKFPTESFYNLLGLINIKRLIKLIISKYGYIESVILVNNSVSL